MRGICAGFVIFVHCMVILKAEVDMNAPVNTLRKLPIGIQSFEKFRSEGFLYVDKTPFVFRLAQAGVPHPHILKTYYNQIMLRKRWQPQ